MFHVFTNYKQVLTGVIPYDGGDKGNMLTRIRLGGRPSRPTDPSQSRRLQDQVWNVVKACWNDNPGQRCELSIAHRAFSTSAIAVEPVHHEQPDARGSPPPRLGGLQDIRNGELGD